MSQRDDPSAEIAALKRRFAIMVAVDVVCVLAGIAGLAAYFAAHLAFGVWLFVAALAGGFSAQLWFLAAMRGNGSRSGA